MSKGRMSRNKGKRGERMLATELREAFFEHEDQIRRGWQVREGDDDPDVITPLPFWFESKFLARYNTAPLIQAINDARGRGIPVAVIRTNRNEPVALLRWHDLLEMIQVYVRTMRPYLHEGVAERFWAKVDKQESGCWIWTAGLDEDGYGFFQVEKGMKRRASHVAWVLTRMVTPKQLNHTCRSRSCVNPDHLYEGTPKQNYEDRVKDGTTLEGERNPNAKLTSEAANSIRKSFESSSVLAKRYGVSDSLVRYVRAGKGWKQGADDERQRRRPERPLQPGSGHVLCTERGREDVPRSAKRRWVVRLR